VELRAPGTPFGNNPFSSACRSGPSTIANDRARRFALADALDAPLLTRAQRLAATAGHHARVGLASKPWPAGARLEIAVGRVT
jgi:hypothetical protein